MSETDFLGSGLSRRGVWIGAIAVFLFSFLLRLGGIGWGLPTEYRHQSLHPDELLIEQAALSTPYFQPGFYNYGTLYLTTLKVAVDMGRTYGFVSNKKDSHWEDPRSVHLTGRVISAAAGAGTVAIVFALLMGIAGVLGATVGALSLAIAPGHLVHSRFQTTDVFATFFIALALFFILRISSGNRNSLWAGVAIGLATGTKYTGILLLIPLLWACRSAVAINDAQPPNSPRRATAMSLIGFCVALLVATPGMILQPAEFWSGFTYELAHSAAGHGIVFANTPNGFIYHLQNLMTAYSLAPLLIALAALAWALYRQEKWAVLLGLFFIAYYIVIGRAEVKFMRYVVPLLPVLAVALGWAVGEFHRRGGYARLASGAVVLLLGFSIVSPTGAAQMTAFMRAEDPRDQAATWLKGKGTIGFVSDPWFYSPPVFPDIGLLAPESRLSRMAENPQLLRYREQSGSRKDWDARLITEMRPANIVFSSFEFIDNDRINQPDLVAFIPLLGKEYKLAAVFWGYKPAYPTKDEAKKPVTRGMLRQVFYGRFPLVHDMMYIQPTICVFQKR